MAVGHHAAKARPHLKSPEGSYLEPRGQFIRGQLLVSRARQLREGLQLWATNRRHLRPGEWLYQPRALAVKLALASQPLAPHGPLRFGIGDAIERFSINRPASVGLVA